MIEPIEYLEQYDLWQVGSRIGDNRDFILISENINLNSVYHNMMQYYEQVWISDDSVQVRYAEIIWNFAVFERRNFEQRIESILALAVYAEIRDWLKGYWIPERFIIDIIRSDFISGNQKFHEDIVALLKENWEKYKNELCKKIKMEIDTKHVLLEKEKKEGNAFWIRRLRDDIVLAQARLMNLNDVNPRIGFEINLQ